MQTTAKFERKENELNTTQCKVDKIIELNSKEYESFRKNLLKDYEFIWDFEDNMYVDKNGIAHGLLVLGENISDGILVNSEGSSYGRYTAILPNARDFINSAVQKMADYITKNGLLSAENGNFNISWKDISKKFDTPISSDNIIGKLLYAELLREEEFSNCLMTEDNIKMTYKSNEESVISLSSLLKCNLEDIHLCHVDEEHDLATIVELNENTLTEKGKEDWSDILNAEVKKIYSGFYGLQFDIVGCSPERLRDFSFMLAGQCSVEEYDKWVNDFSNTQEMKME